MKVKVGDLFIINSVLNNIKEKEIGNFNFKYGVARNIKRLEPEIKVIRENLPKYTQEFAEFEAKRVQLCINYAKSEENGELQIIDGNYIIPEEKMQEFNKKIDKLKKDYDKVIKENEEIKSTVDKVMEEIVEFDFYRIDPLNFPDELNMSEIDAFLRVGILED